MSFEEQKQRIINILCLEYKKPPLCQLIDCEYRDYIVKLIKQLTPPKPTTCASCKKLTNCKISNVVFAMHNAIEFGCNQHSDYERK